MPVIPQKIFATPPTINVEYFDRRKAGIAATRIQEASPKIIGMAIKTSDPIGRALSVCSVALATCDPDLVVIFRGNSGSHSKSEPQNDEHLQRIFDGNSSGPVIAGFDMVEAVLYLSRDLGMPVSGYDLSTSLPSFMRNSPSPCGLAGQFCGHIADKARLSDLWRDEGSPRGKPKGNPAGDTDSEGLALRAWVSARLAYARMPDILKSHKIDTGRLRHDELYCLGKMQLQFEALDNLKPKEVHGEFTDESVMRKDGTLRIVNKRYKTRVKVSHQTITVTGRDGRKFSGAANTAKGRETIIKLNGASSTMKPKSIKVSGPPDLTNSEKASRKFLLYALQGKIELRDSAFIRQIWFKENAKPSGTQSMAGINPMLNDSQRSVVSAMAGAQPLVVAHGPPGTGKTTVISAAAKIWEALGCPSWIVAHSNVAVKNIAEKLFRDKIKFIIIVSFDFDFEWHEHLYREIKKSLIRTDALRNKTAQDLERIVGSTKIILSTLSMLSNTTLDQLRMFTLVPVERLVIDEASQINIYEYMHVFYKFRKVLEKVCFFGDPKQLEPYGSDNIPSLNSIFDIGSPAYFLDTQYRMPCAIGEFISKEVYGGRLKSVHDTTTMACVAFVDARGKEIKSRRSWVNQKEINTIVHLVRHYYKDTDFCVLTPYDAQRAAIQAQLEKENLPWEHVFNVDSFQGNESDFVLISVVRSQKPGFLVNQSRMNVMLTRCKKGMVIVTNEEFLKNGGKSTMLAALLRHWETKHGHPKTWVTAKNVMNRRAHLPGIPGRR